MNPPIVKTTMPISNPTSSKAESVSSCAKEEAVEGMTKVKSRIIAMKKRRTLNIAAIEKSTLPRSLRNEKIAKAVIMPATARATDVGIGEDKGLDSYLCLDK